MPLRNSSGSGSGYRSGFGDGFGFGDGSGFGDGDGNGDGSGSGDGFGSGSGSGFGFGSGSGFGDGFGLPAMHRQADRTPRRIQRSRAKGWKMPPNTVYVGRGSRWENPWRVGEHGDARECVDLFVRWIAFGFTRLDKAAEEHLRGKNLACWCRLDQPCHADVLLELANAPLRCKAADA